MSKRKFRTQWTYDTILAEARRYTTPEYSEAAKSLVGMKKGRMIFSKGMLGDMIKVHKSRLLALEESRPIAIGPATLDSLVEETPDSYDYLERGNLPFEKMFFEFVDPVSLRLPLGGPSQIHAIRFHKAGSDLSLHPLRSTIAKALGYQATVYFRESNDSQLQDVALYFTPGNLGIYSGVSDKGKFYIDLALGKVFYTTSKEYTEMPWHERFFTSLIKGGHAHAVNLDQFPEKDSVIKIASLCTNIVNYINSQNTILIEGQRQITEAVKDSKGTIRNVEREVPFYFVDIKQKVAYEDPVPTDRTWELTERICVRGHPRKYRNEDRSIREVIWIEPYTKGPPNAPWRDQRHRLMSEKIERERAFVSKIKGEE